MKKKLFSALLAGTLAVSGVAGMPLMMHAAGGDLLAEAAYAATTTAATTTTTANTTTAEGTAAASDGKAAASEVSDAQAAADAAAEKAEAEAPKVLAPITLTLKQAYEKMEKDSPQAIMANYNYKNEEAVGKGYSENLQNLKKAEKSDAFVDTSSKASIEKARDFAKTQAPKNLEAAMNALKLQTYEMYYNYKYAEAGVQVAKDNLSRNEALYKSTQLQYKVGKVAKLDTLTAENNLNSAKEAYQTAVNGFEQMKMNYNMFMGYNIQQPLTLTDELKPVGMPTTTLEQAIAEALKNRNEIASAEYAAEVSALNLNNYKAYPKSSAKYLKAKVGYDMALEGLKTAPSTVEIDVRTKYMDMQLKHDSVVYNRTAYANAKESARLGQLQFDNGFITLTDLSGLNLAAFNSQQAYFKSVLDYNMAVNKFKLCTGVGTESAQIN